MKEYFIWLLKLLTLVVLVLIAIPLLVGSLALVGSAGKKIALESSKRAVAVIELDQPIMSSKETLDVLYREADNPKVQGIVFRVSTPGGAVGPSQEIYSAVKKLKAKKPIVVSMGGVAASGGLYVSLAASQIFAQPGTITGSIGVILQFPNFQKVAEKIGVDFVTVKSGKLKDVGNSFREMTEEERAFLQGTVDLVHREFIQAVVESRKLEAAKVEEFADGRVIMGTQAKELGLIDGFGDVHDAARAVFELLGKPLKADEQPQLIYPADKFGQFKKFLESAISLPILNQTRGRYELMYMLVP
jgi:protease-4